LRFFVNDSDSVALETTIFQATPDPLVMSTVIASPGWTRNPGITTSGAGRISVQALYEAWPPVYCSEMPAWIRSPLL
jgi:hypothetical protein